jgi:hypothetical protein
MDAHVTSTKGGPGVDVRAREVEAGWVLTDGPSLRHDPRTPNVSRSVSVAPRRHPDRVVNIGPSLTAKQLNPSVGSRKMFTGRPVDVRSFR